MVQAMPSKVDLKLHFHPRGWMLHCEASPTRVSPIASVNPTPALKHPEPRSRQPQAGGAESCGRATSPLPPCTQQPWAGALSHGGPARSRPRPSGATLKSRRQGLGRLQAGKGSFHRRWLFGPCLQHSAFGFDGGVHGALETASRGRFQWGRKRVRAQSRVRRQTEPTHDFFHSVLLPRALCSEGKGFFPDFRPCPYCSFLPCVGM